MTFQVFFDLRYYPLHIIHKNTVNPKLNAVFSLLINDVKITLSLTYVVSPELCCLA